MSKHNLKYSEAVAFVRSRLEEYSSVENELVVADIDDRNLETTVENLLLESVEHVHLTAPADKLEGVATVLDAGDLTVVLSEGVIDVSDKRNTSYEVLRFLWFKAKDSGYLVGRLVQEDSPVGRMQLDRYVMGRPDDPVLVMMADSDEHIHLRYYTTKATSSTDDLFSMAVVERPERKVASDGDYVETDPSLVSAVLNHLTARVMQTYGMQGSEIPLQLSSAFSGNGVAGITVNTP